MAVRHEGPGHLHTAGPHAPTRASTRGHDIFRPPAFAFWSSCSRPGVELSSRSADRTHTVRTPTGFPRFARTSNDRGGRPLYPEDNGAHPDRSRSPASVYRITAACPCAPPQPPSMRDSASRGINQGFTQVRPSSLPLACCARMERARLGFPPSFAPRPHGQRTSRRGQAIEHEPETRSTSSTQPPILRVYSMRATSRRTSPMQSPALRALQR